MKTIKGPAIFLAQFAGDAAPFNALGSIARWAADHGYKGVQIPSWDGRLFDLAKAAESDAYCDEVKGTLKDAGVELTELSTHLQGQLVAVHPAYDEGFDAFAAPEVRGNPKARQAWAVDQMHKAAAASKRLGLAQPRDLLGRARLALSLPLAAAAGRPDRDRVRRAGQALEADPGRVRRRRRRRLLRDPSGRGPDRRRDLRDVPGAGRQPSALLHQLRSQPLLAATARLPGLHRRLSRADQGVPRQGRGVQPEPAARASTAAFSPGCSAPAGSARSATARSTSSASSPSSRATTTTAGRCSNGSAA